MAFANFLTRRNQALEGLRLTAWAALVFVSPAFAEDPVALVHLSPSDPSLSHAVIRLAGGSLHRCPVGSGKRGIKPEGARFEGGWSLLGRFRVSAVLSMDRFEMEPALIDESERSPAYLREHLFANMSQIDFDEDGAGGEYGAGFVGLRPESGTAQPFAFGEYRGVYRWYSYAIHGTEDETRVGQRSTGGCINLRAEDLRIFLASVRVGDLVEVQAIP